MTHDEIIRWFRRFRHDPEFSNPRTGARTVPLRCLCEFMGIARANLYLVLSKKAPLSHGYHERLAYAIACVEHGLRFRRNGRQWEPIGDYERLPRYETPPKREHPASKHAHGAL